jgi:hypothetical protein
MVMSRQFVLMMIAKCGLEVADKICEYDEIIEPSLKAEVAGVVMDFSSSVDGFFRRVVWKLRARRECGVSDLRECWLHGNPMWLFDCAKGEDLNLAALRTIDMLQLETTKLADEVAALKVALLDRERDLAITRNELALRSCELIDRTTRLENALAELDRVSGTGSGLESRSQGWWSPFSRLLKKLRSE